MFDIMKNVITEHETIKMSENIDNKDSSQKKYREKEILNLRSSDNSRKILFWNLMAGNFQTHI